MLAPKPSSPAPLSVALVLGARTFPRLGMRRGVERFVREHDPDWQLVRTIHHTHPDWQEAEASHLDGLIGFFEDPAQFEWVHSRGIPAVNINRVPGCSATAEVFVDDLEAGRSAARYFLERGFRRFSFCTHAPHKGFSQDRFKGFSEELARHGRKTSEFTIEGNGSQAPENFDRVFDPRIEDRLAVFCCDDACGGYLTRLCRTLGLRIPGDLVILGAGDDAFHVENDSVTLSSVKIDFQAVGYQAAAMIDALLRGESPPAEAIRIVSSGITERLSTGNDAESPALRRLLRLIEERHTDPDFNPIIAAKLCQVSSRTLRRYLKEADRPSFSDLLRERRLETAMQQLITTDDPVEHISEIAGFLDYTTFFRAFRRRYGMSPSDCRKQSEIRPLHRKEDTGLTARSA